jgi:hypothetical protein
MKFSSESHARQGWRGAISKLAAAGLAASALTLIAISPSQAASPLELGAADHFAIFGNGFSNTGASSVTGDLGISPVLSFSDSGTLNLTGDYHFGDAAAIKAKSAIVTAFAAISSTASTANVTADLGSQTLVPGVYKAITGLSLNGTLTLDAQNNPNSVFIFQTPGTLSTAANSHINFINGGNTRNLFWQVGSTATLGSTSDFKGTILAGSNIVAATGATISGRLFSTGGSVALNANTVSRMNVVTPTTLFVVPDMKTVAYGTQKVSFTAKYERVNNVATSAVDPGRDNHGFIAPVCVSTPAYSVTQVPGVYPITCTGGNGGSLYLLNTSDTAQLTIAKVATSVKINLNAKNFLPGSTLAITSSVVAQNSVAVCTGVTTYGLDRNPLTGVVGSYPLTASTVTTGWKVGNYVLSASYVGDANCVASVGTAKVIVGAAPVSFTSIQGEGKYILSGARAQFAFQIKNIVNASATATPINGQVTWMQNKAWKFQGSLNAYSITNGVSQVSGIGNLYMWNKAYRHDGKWVLATTNPALVTFKFTTSAANSNSNSDGENSDNSHAKVISFAIGFTGQPVVGVTALPTLGALVDVGNNKKHD